MSDLWRILGVIGFFFVFFLPCGLVAAIALKKRDNDNDGVFKVFLIAYFIVCILFFVQASIVNFSFSIGSQIAWNVFLAVDLVTGLLKIFNKI